MFDPILAIACVAFVFAAPVLVYFFVLDRADARKLSSPKGSASSHTHVGRE